MDNFFSKQNISLMSKEMGNGFFKTISDELNKALKNMAKKDREFFESKIQSIITNKDEDKSVKRHFDENFYKAEVGRRVMLIDKNLITEGKIESVNSSKKMFEMIVKKSTNKKMLGVKITVSKDMFNDGSSACVFQ